MCARRGPSLQMWNRAAAPECCKRGQSPGWCADFLPQARNVGVGRRGKRFCQVHHKNTDLRPSKIKENHSRRKALKLEGHKVRK